jgi:Helicase associated domain
MLFPVTFRLLGSSWIHRGYVVIDWSRAINHWIQSYTFFFEDPSFAEWVHRQRTTHAHWMKQQSDQDDPQAEQLNKRHHLLKEIVEHRMKLLEDLGFHFTVHYDKWMVHWEELKAYKEVHGNCMVPTHCTENPQLGRWVHTQRHQRRLQLKGKKSCMTDERVQLLDSLGFSWDVRQLHYRDKANERTFLFPVEHSGQHGYLSSDSDSQVTGTGMDVADPTMASDRGYMLLAQQEQQNTVSNSNSDAISNEVSI